MQLIRSWIQIRSLTAAQIRARYRRTIAGFFWVVLSPLIMYAAQATVFKHILKIGIPHYGIFLLSGLLPWLFVVNTLEMGIPVLRSSRDLLGSFRIPPHWLVLSVALDNAINFAAATLIVLIPMIALLRPPMGGLWTLPFSFLILVIGTAALTSWLAVLNVFFRDTRFVVHFLISVLFFLTPVFYPAELIPEPWRQGILLNPVYILLEPLRLGIYGYSFPKFLASFGRSLVVCGLFVSIAVFSWRRQKNEFYHFL
ncbi:MAG: hypothetical protein A2Z97_03280 [Bdellovibrionales bacterium GWB1_52_6]|nr:MAG: hypothetical protein A2Z97_03280 [Bdellovibrionales bacterium GWB1_52_6]OFZ02895.1 MAG: hypothetical protein A2X97_04805 [Bdellovibrionales bacterium GWA1_52_35]HCM38478.1 hypothetical protein [Bdellovibrionales bacterium]